MKIIEIRENLFLKELEIEDAGHIFKAIDSQREYLGKWLPFVEFTKTVKDSLDYVNSVVTMPEECKEWQFAVFCGNDFAGLAGFKGTDRLNRKSEIGYWLREEFQGRGIMTDSIRALIRFGFSELDLNRIQIKCARNNVKSNKIPQRLGFSFEGIERDSEFVRVGVFRDANVWSLLKREVLI
ncbi:GNAT family N-acetyltransferase [bacterium]|nr:GNAT family N-acetyltransferase [bacterium]